MKWRKLYLALNWVAMGAGLVAVALTVWFLGRSFSTKEYQPMLVWSEEEKKLLQELSQLRVGFEGQEEALHKVNSQIEAALTTAEKSPADFRLAAMQADIESLRGRVGELETTISDSPTKAVSIPLLKQDLENVKVNLQREIESSNKQIDRIYDQNKWFIGLMVTITIGFVSMVIAHVVQLRKGSIG